MELINWSSLLIQAINIAIVVYVLNRFLFQPYMRYIDEQAKKQAEFEENVRASDRILSEARKEADRIVSNAQKDAKSIMTQAEGLAKKESALLLSDARNEAQLIKKKAEQDIENDRERLYGEIRSKSLDIALRLNEKLFGKKEANEDFIRQAIKE